MSFEQNEFKLFLGIFKKATSNILSKFPWISNYFFSEHQCLRNFPEISGTENSGSNVCIKYLQFHWLRPINPLLFSFKSSC